MSDISQKLYDTAFKFEEANGGCCQCVLGSVKENLGNISDDLFQAATAMAGGVAASGNACGACTGAILALGAFRGRDWENFATTEGNDVKNEMTMVARKILERFENEFGSFRCAEIQEKILGKSYKMYVPEEKAAFLDAGGHGPEGCTRVVALAAKWVGEILEEEGLIK